MTRTLIHRATVVLPAAVIPDAHVLVERGRIVSVGRGTQETGTGDRMDAEGVYVLPGLVDLHSDAVEREIEPRPNTLFPLDLAVREMERRLAGHGITTIFHSISVAGAEFGPRSHDLARRLVETIHAQHDSALIGTRVHLRYEVTDRAGLPLVRDVLDRGLVHLLSFMDHTPGQGQYHHADEYRRYLTGRYGISGAEFEKILDAKLRAREGLAGEIAALAARTRAMGIPLASHDDDSPEKLDAMRRWGITISEFPMSLEAAMHAAASGTTVCIGAPNVIRGGSTGKNLRAIDAIEAGAAQVLCSDYYPAAILHAVFQLADGPLTLPQAVAMATLAPARAAGIDQDVGSLEVGKQADLILVRTWGALPVVVAVMVNGGWVYQVGYGRWGGMLDAGPALSAGRRERGR